MRLREWHEEENQRAGGENESGETGDTLERIRNRAEALLGRASDTLRKVESGESERFMKAVLQQGGQ